jgi:hypothetical protein
MLDEQCDRVSFAFALHGPRAAATAIRLDDGGCSEGTLQSMDANLRR